MAILSDPLAAHGAVTAFPRSIADFAQDQRISYSKTDNKYILENDDGTEWEFDEAAERWIPSLDEALYEEQRKAYAVEGVDETEEVQPKKRKVEITNDEAETFVPGSKPKKAKPSTKPAAERRNTAVYITGLPRDVTVDEIEATFKTCGVIAEEIDSGKPHIRIYTDENGVAKGDGFVRFFRPESVILAIQMLDDSDLRMGQPGPEGKMRVKEADLNYKKVKDTSAPEAQKTYTKDKKKIIKKTQKMNNKLADWDDDDPSVIKDTSSKWDKVVILKYMFTLEELADDPAAMLEIKEDIREECEKLGPVTNVVLYDKEADGIVTVRFGNVEAAEACVKLNDGRSFDRRKVKAYIADGSERFKKSSERKVEEEGEEERLDEFGAWLEAEEK